MSPVILYLYPYLNLYAHLQPIIVTPIEVQKKVQFTTTSVGFQQILSFWGLLHLLSATISHWIHKNHIQPPPFEWLFTPYPTAIFDGESPLNFIKPQFFKANRPSIRGMELLIINFAQQLVVSHLRLGRMLEVFGLF